MDARDPSPKPVLVGDHLAMDLLNSIENLADPRTDCLLDGFGLIRWLEVAEAIDPATAGLLLDHDIGVLDKVAEEARDLREWFREFLRDNHPVEAQDLEKQLTYLNQVLARDDSHGRLVVESHGAHDHAHGHLTLVRERRWYHPDQLLQPLASAIAHLLAEEDLDLVRNCEGPTCSLMFLDRTKSHKRRWCSMAACGNRAKAAAHRARASGGRH